MRRHLALLIVGTLVVFASPVSGQLIGIYADPQGNSSCVDADAGQLVPLYVVVRAVAGEEPLSSVRFRTPQPDCGIGIAWWEPVYSLTYIGPQETTVYFESCQPLPVHVLTVQAIGSLPTDCCFLDIDPVDATDCAGSVVPLGQGHYSLIDTLCTLIPPRNPYPPDGATAVPRNVVLTWDEMEGPDYCSDVKWYTVCFGTNPDPPVVTTDGYTFYDPPGLLQENTAYFWRVVGIRSGFVSSPVWSFSTGAPVPVAHSTWGRIKALYR